MSSKLPVRPRVKPQFTRNGIEHADWKPPKMVYQQSDRDIKVIEPTHHADQAVPHLPLIYPSFTPEGRRDYWQTSPTVTMLKGLLFVSVNPRASESPWRTLKV